MAASAQQLTLEIKDYATLPITGSPERVTDNVASLLARISFLREEPGGKRFFVFTLPETPAGGEKGTVHVTVLENLFDEVRRRIP